MNSGVVGWQGTVSTEQTLTAWLASLAVELSLHRPGPGATVVISISLHSLNKAAKPELAKDKTDRGQFDDGRRSTEAVLKDRRGQS